jgi:hypothetical protein
MSDHDSLPLVPADDPGDPFAPERVDDTITARLEPGAPTDEATWLVRGLAAAHALPPEAEASLRRVRARLQAAPLAAPLAASGADTRAGRVALTSDLGTISALRHPARAQTRVSAGLRALAAVLVVGVLAGSFVAVLRLRAGVPTANVAWQDAGITAARARGAALGFDPARGVTYAVSDAAPGSVYACGANHLWYSLDGGQTYQPFTPALPAGDTQHCAIATVPGAPGLFTYLPDPQAPSNDSAPDVVGYATPGVAHWQVLRVPTTIPAEGTSFGVEVAADEIWTQIANNANGDQVRAVGNWITTLLPQPGVLGGPRYPIATPDFGANWTWLGQPLKGNSLLCTGIYTDPTTPTHLYCAGAPSASTQPADIYETRDGGKLWTATGIAGMLTNPPSNSGNPNDPSYQFVSGADTHSIYLYAPSSQLLRRSLHGGDWQFVTSFVDQIQIAGATADDSVYTVTRTGGQLHALRLAPESKALDAYGPALALPSQDDAVSFALGDTWPDGQPALYVRGTNQPSTHPLWRLALAPLASAGPVDMAPLPTARPATPATVPVCPSGAAGSLSDIQPGGLGADIGTFAPRWGPAQGTALSTTYYGRYADTGAAPVAVTAPASNGRVFALFYTPDTTQSFAQSQAQALALGILPSDAEAQGQPQTVTVSGATDLVTYYCSAAFAAAFPVGTQAIAPLIGSGLIVETDHLSASGTVTSVDLRAYGT